MLVGVSPDDDGLAAPRRMVELLDRGEERVKVDEQDGGAFPWREERLHAVVHGSYFRLFKRSSRNRPFSVRSSTTSTSWPESAPSAAASSPDMMTSVV